VQSSNIEALKQIPPVNDILRSAELSEFHVILNAPFAVSLLENVLAEVRRELAENRTVVARSALTTKIAAKFAQRLRESLRPSLRRVINATGVVLHTNLGRSPLPEPAIDHLRDVSIRYSNLEFDIDAAARGKRDVHIEKILVQLLGCEAAIVVNNNAAAVLLVLNTFGEGGEVVASRGEQVEIGGSFRIPEVMTKSGAHLREVGTTNRTRIKDYERAINEQTRLLLRVHPSNFRMIGFTERPSVEEFVDLGKRRGITTFEDLGSGCLSRMDFTGADEEPGAIDSIRAGVDVVCFSGDKLLGGPQAGIIAGRKPLIEKVRQNALFRALRVDKLTISVLEFVLSAHLQGRIDDIPIWRMLRATEMQLKHRVDAFVRRVGPRAKPVQLMSVVGGGSAPGAHYSSWGIAAEVAGLSDVELERRFRNSTPPVITRLEEGRVLLDFRTIFPEEENELLAVFQQL
jgi:L-seryl-tRNA(Ser) seleniumtransferase